MKLPATNRAVHRCFNILHERLFSLEEARRALCYLEPVLRDAVDSYQQAQRARAALISAISNEQRLWFAAQRDKAIAQLNRTIDECHSVGVCMVDIAKGKVALTVEHENIQVCVIWTLGESINTPWQEIDAQTPLLHQQSYAAHEGCPSPR